MVRRTVLALLLLLCTATLARAAPPSLTPSLVGEDPLAGGVFRFPQAVTLNASGGTVFVGDQYSGVVQAFGADGTPRFTLGARASRREPGRLGIVGGVALDRSGHLYVLDSENERVQAFAAADGRHLASFGDASLFDLVGGNPTTGAGISASGMAVDQRPGGPPVVFVADQGRDRVARFVLDPTTLVPVGSPTFSTLGLSAPQGLTLDPAGTRLYVADDDNHRVVVLDPVSLQYLTQVGSFGTGPGQFQNPYDVAVDAASPSRLYVADNLNNRVDLFDAGSLASLGSFGGFGRTPGLFSIVRAVGAVADDPRGGVEVADTANNRIQALGTDGSVQAAWGIAGRGPGYLTRPRGVAFAPDGGVTVADAFDQRVARFAPDGTFVSQLGLISSFNGFATQGPAAGQLSLPSGVAYGPDGTAWVADTGNNRVQAYGPDGATRAFAVASPTAVTGDGAGGVYVAGGPGVVRVAADGSSSTAQSGLSGPSAVAFDGARVFAADASRVLRAGATIAPPPGEATWDHPSGMAVDPATGTLYVSERRPGVVDGARIVRGTPSSATYTWDTIAREGAALGQVIEPAGLALSADGLTLLVADTGNNRVQRLDAAGAAPPPTAPLSVEVAPITRGQVTSDLPGIGCATDCRQRYGAGRVVTLTATAQPGSVLTGWTGACAPVGNAPTCAVTMSGAQAAGATFAAVPPPPPAPPPTTTTAAPPPPLPPPPPPPVRLTGARLRPNVLRAHRPARRGATSRRSTRARLTFTLSRPAKVTLAVALGRRGVRRGSACVARTASNRRRRPCTRFAVLPVRRTIRASRAGTVTATVTSPFAKRRLRPGRYRLLLTALDTSGTRVGPAVVSFRVAAARR